MPDLLSRRPAPPPPRAEPDPAFAARPRLLALRAALRRAARPARWGEPPVFFFDPQRQAELEAARGPDPDPAGALARAELPLLIADPRVRRAARAVEGLAAAARAAAPRCPAARALADLLAVPDDEVFLALWPERRAGVRLHLRGAATVAQLIEVLVPALTGAPAGAVAPVQLFRPDALAPGGALPEGPAGCAHWLWPEMPLALVPRRNGERVVLVGPAAVRAPLDPEPPFPGMAVTCTAVDALNAFRTADALARLLGGPVPVAAAPVARAA